jgi:hypothetical protein
MVPCIAIGKEDCIHPSAQVGFEAEYMSCSISMDHSPAVENQSVASLFSSTTLQPLALNHCPTCTPNPFSSPLRFPPLSPVWLSLRNSLTTGTKTPRTLWEASQLPKAISLSSSAFSSRGRTTAVALFSTPTRLSAQLTATLAVPVAHGASALGPL